MKPVACMPQAGVTAMQIAMMGATSLQTVVNVCTLQWERYPERVPVWIPWYWLSSQGL